MLSPKTRAPTRPGTAKRRNAKPNAVNRLGICYSRASTFDPLESRFLNRLQCRSASNTRADQHYLEGKGDIALIYRGRTYSIGLCHRFCFRTRRDSGCGCCRSASHPDRCKCHRTPRSLIFFAGWKSRQLSIENRRGHPRHSLTHAASTPTRRPAVGPAARGHRGSVLPFPRHGPRHASLRAYSSPSCSCSERSAR